jgi:MFS family permease
MGFSLFLINRYNKIEEFALISLALNFLGGIFANMFYAYICDTYEPKYIRIKAYVAAFNMLVATFCYFFAFFFFKSFAMLVVFIAIEEFFGEGSAAPSLSMMTLTAPRGTDASVIGLFVISSGVGTIVMSLILGSLV